jgi:hypothetical protein
MRGFALAVLFAASTSFAYAEVLDRATIHALMSNGRPVEARLLFTGLRAQDTGVAFEDCLEFQDDAGRRTVFLSRGFSAAELRSGRYYRLRFQYVRYTPRGLPVAQLAQSADPPRRDVFEDDIRETDPRAEEIRARVAGGAAAPAEIRLRYSGKRGDFLAFYDIEGREIHFRYREDRFDRRAERRVADLIEGQAYRVKGRYAGVLLNSQWIAVGAPEYAAAIQDPDCVLAYEYESAYPLRADQILF